MQPVDDEIQPDLSPPDLSPKKRKYAALVSYAGTPFCGWQRQSGSGQQHGYPSVQETLEGALRQVSDEPKVNCVGSGRTDSGVHATGQVTHFTLHREWNTRNLKEGMNSLLPGAIRVLDVRPVPIEFHAQRSAVKKQYSYYFLQGPASLPHLDPFALWIRKRLDDRAMQEALDALKGRHDFKAFQAAGGAELRTTVREILEAEVTRQTIEFPTLTPVTAGHAPLEFVRVRLVGTGFLKQMVRGISGTLLQIGEGRRPSGDMKRVLEAGVRKGVGPTAAGRGLWLERVWYPGLDWEMSFPPHS